MITYSQAMVVFNAENRSVQSCESQSVDLMLIAKSMSLCPQQTPYYPNIPTIHSFRHAPHPQHTDQFSASKITIIYNTTNHMLGHTYGVQYKTRQMEWYIAWAVWSALALANMSHSTECVFVAYTQAADGCEDIKRWVGKWQRND